MTRYRWNEGAGQWEFFEPEWGGWCVLRQSPANTAPPMAFAEGVQYLRQRPWGWDAKRGVYIETVSVELLPGRNDDAAAEREQMAARLSIIAQRYFDGARDGKTLSVSQASLIQDAARLLRWKAAPSTRCPQMPIRVTVPADLSHTRAPREKAVDVDACVAPIIAALHAAGIETRGSCCGHGGSGEILLGNNWRLVREAPPVASAAEGQSNTELVERIVRDVCEALGDDSPEDQPDLISIKVDELRAIVENALAAEGPHAITAEALASALCDSSSHVNLMPHADQRPCDYHRKRAAATLAALATPRASREVEKPS